MSNISKEQIAKDLLSIKAVFLRPDHPFTWASGILSPIYCDNRLTLSFPNVRFDIENAIAESVKEHFPETEILMGTSTAGIAHAAISAYLLNLPMGYVRSSNKTHGRENLIEGKLEKGQKTVVIEDLISTGGSVLQVVDALRKEGADVLGVVSIFTYSMQIGIENLKNDCVQNYSLCDFETLISIAVKENYINEEDFKKLKAFILNPNDASWQNV